MRRGAAASAKREDEDGAGGAQVGELPDDETLPGGMIRNICCANARDLLRLPSITEARDSVKTARR